MHSETNLLEDYQLRVPTCIDTYYVLSCFKICCCDPFFSHSFFFFFFFLAGSTTCKNPEESDHVRLLPWAWCVRHQWPFPAGKDTSSPVYAAVFKSAVSDISAVLELLAELQFDTPPRSKTPPCKVSLEEIAHSHDLALNFLLPLYELVYEHAE